MEMKNVFTEKIPAFRLIGKKYYMNDDWSQKWEEFFQNGWFDILEKSGGNSEFDYLGMKRIKNGELEYWIGMIFPENAEIPRAFEFVDVEELDYVVFWLYGKSGELTGMSCHEKCLEELKEIERKRKEDNWCIERYNCPRFTTPDEKGNVILDYYISVE